MNFKNRGCLRCSAICSHDIIETDKMLLDLLPESADVTKLLRYEILKSILSRVVDHEDELKIIPRQTFSNFHIENYNSIDIQHGTDDLPFEDRSTYTDTYAGDSSNILKDTYTHVSEHDHGNISDEHRNVLEEMYDNTFKAYDVSVMENFPIRIGLMFLVYSKEMKCVPNVERWRSYCVYDKHKQRIEDVMQYKPMLNLNRSITIKILHRQYKDGYLYLVHIGEGNKMTRRNAKASTFQYTVGEKESVNISKSDLFREKSGRKKKVLKSNEHEQFRMDTAYPNNHSNETFTKMPFSFKHYKTQIGMESNTIKVFKMKLTL